MQSNESKRLVWGAVIAAVLLIGVAGVFAFDVPGLSKYQKVKPVNGVATVPLSKVSDGTAHFYRFPASGKDVGFFIVKGADGVLRTAFDSCDVCFQAKKGYTQQGDFMVCNNCNRRFAIANIGPHAVGGCNPSYLVSTISGGSVVINTGDLQTGAKYF